MSNKKVIANGTVVTSEGQFLADILIEDGKIINIGEGLSTADAQVIDVSEAFVFPGGVDIHTHLAAPLAGTVTCDDFESGTKAAAFGGTTTLVDYALHSKGRLLKETVNDWMGFADGECYVDYGFHVSIVDLNEKTAKEIPDLIKEGITSFKVFTTYRGALMVEDGVFFNLLRLTKDLNGLVMVHAESGDVIDALVADALASGKTGPLYHALTRPVETEVESISRCIAFAELAGAPLFVVHVSTIGGLKKIQEAQAAGLPIYAETCPHYLYLDEKLYHEPGFESAKYVCSPPIRASYHGDYLWKGLENGSIQVLASDHCPFTYEQKHLGEGNFSKIPNGMPSLEARFMLGYQGVCDGKMSLSRFADVVATQPAKFAGLYPRKGTLLPGSDADLVVLDPSGETSISSKTLHEKSGYTPFEGFKLRGSIKKVMVRGEFVVDEGNLVAGKGYGEFLKRGTFSR
jgi:dihydropyrimidinase